MSDELKIVLDLKGTEGTVGIKEPDTDPAFFTVTGDLPAVLGQVPALVEKARTAWSVSKTYPKTAIPVAPPPTPSAPRPSTPAKPPAPKLQPSFDL
jgi:hypothetical protein